MPPTSRSRSCDHGVQSSITRGTEVFETARVPASTGIRRSNCGCDSRLYDSPQRVDLNQLEREAKNRLEPHVHAAIARGVGASLSFDRNLAAWQGIQLAPRVLAGVNVVEPITTVLGTRVATPVLLAPAGLPRSASQGEIAAAEGAAAAGSLMVLSHFATVNLEEVAAAAPDCPRWFQLYLTKDRDYCADLLLRARVAGYRAVVLTVDSGGGIALEGVSQDPAWDLQPMRGSGVFDLTASTADVAWVKDHAKLPVAVKGILRPDDARRCVDAGADAIIVSNHGGRSLDGAVATATALPYVTDAVGSDAEVYVDGGIRSGSDVIKAFALGARAVFIGQPWVWAACAGGRDLVAQLIRDLTTEFVCGLAMCGIDRLDAIDRKILWTQYSARTGIGSWA
jgi:4-hydroxymandelate oxidase